MLKRLVLTTVALSIMLFTKTSFADTLKLVSVGPTAGGAAVYPYNFSINGSTSTTALMCMDYNRHVTVGEQWNVSVNSLSLASDLLSTAYRAEAYLFSQLGSTADAVALQFSAWYFFDQSVTSNSAWNSSDMTLVTTAWTKAQDATLMNSGFFSQFRVYAPLTDATSQKAWTAGIPQEFIGRVTPIAPTPEPSSLLMLGTGVMGAAFTLRRKMVRVS